MKMLIEDKDQTGLGSLIGKRVTLFCMNYFYTGDLVGVGENEVLISDAHIIYETGSFEEQEWANAQRVSDTLYIRTSAIESYGVVKS